MVVLTAQMVEARSKCSDYRTVVNLNAWGNDIDDISICAHMTKLEILSLSINRVSTLSSLQNCHRLKELYLRNNAVPHLDELKHLKGCTQLFSLRFEGNPCAEAAGKDYRAIVLRMLPNLKKLDEIEVSNLEVEAALRFEYYEPPVSAAQAQPVEPPVNPKRAAAQARREELEREREREHQLEMGRDGVGISNIGGASNVARNTQRRHISYSTAESPFPLDQDQDQTSPRAGGDSPSRVVHSPRAPVHPQAAGAAPPPPPPPPPNDQRTSSLPRTNPYDNRRGMLPDSPTDRRVTAALVAAAAAAGAVAVQERQEIIDSINQRNARDGGDYMRQARPPHAAVQPHSDYERRTRRNANLLSSAFALIREMDLPTLEALSNAIHDQVMSRASAQPE